MTPMTPPYRQGGGFGSLGVRFQEVVEPAAVPLRPETVGAWITLCLLAAMLVAGVTWLVLRHLRRRYRRAAERELGALGAAWEANRTKLDVLEAVPVVLKRCALSSFERSLVAPLSGERWIAFLSATGAEPFAEAAGRALSTIATRGASAVSAADVPALLAAARGWVRRHRAGL